MRAAAHVCCCSGADMRWLDPFCAGGKSDPKADDPKAGADIGKIVNLMAGDANRVRRPDLSCSLLLPSDHLCSDLASRLRVVLHLRR